MLHEDRRGDLWIGTSQGLLRHADGAFTTYGKKHGLADKWARALCEGRDGSLWVGTHRGLTRYKDGAFVTYAAGDGAPQTTVYAVYEDRDGALWIGTQDAGLSRFKDGKFTSYTTKDGLHADSVYQILEDGQGNLWFGSSKGIFRVSLNELNDFAAGARVSIASVAYGQAEGVPPMVCFSGAQPSAYKSPDGRLWFATQNGVVVIDADHIQMNDRQPPVRVEQMVVDHQEIDLSDAAEVWPGRGDVEIRYTALSFVAPERVRFKYRLEGFDREWVDAGTRRVAYYTNLPPGEYTFKVVAANSDGVWNEAGASLTFRQRPHFYQTSWFYALAFVAAAAIVWAIHLLRVGRVRREHQAVLAERTRIAREMHDTLAQGFAGVAIQLEAAAHMLTASPERVREHLNLARDLVRSSLTEARRSMRGLRAQALETGDLAAALAQMPARLAAGADVRIEVTGTPRRLPQEIENNLLRVAQECLTNAAKHAQADHIRLELCFDARRVRLRVCDDGRGFDARAAAAASAEHFGLTGVRERVEQLGGRLTLRTAPGRGTDIQATIPG